MKFSVCVDAVYNGYDFYEAIGILADNQIKNIEFWTWWDKDIDALTRLKGKYGLNIVAFCTKFYSLVDIKERQTYLEAFEESCIIAKRLGCSQIITKPGNSTGEPFEVQYQHMKETLEMAVSLAKKYDITILLEPVNSKLEAPDTFLDNSDLGFRFIDDIHDSHLLLLYDIYHMQMDEGDVLRRLVEGMSKTGHIHTAGSTERRELCDGELNYDYIFKKIEENGYNGYVGLEYFPAEEPLEGIQKIIQEHGGL